MIGMFISFVLMGIGAILLVALLVGIIQPSQLAQKDKPAPSRLKIILVLSILASLFFVAGYLVKPSEAARADYLAMQQREKDEQDRIEKEENSKKWIRETSEIVCEKNVRSKLTIPKSASFDPLRAKIVFVSDTKINVYNTFEFKNAFNATLEGAYSCDLTLSKDKNGTNVLTFEKVQIGK